MAASATAERPRENWRLEKENENERVREKSWHDAK